MTKRKILFLSLIFVLAFIASGAEASEFNPNYIIDDIEILDYTSMDLSYIKDFLKSKGGYLANYSAADLEGKVMTAAEIIYDRAVTNKINPKFLIVLLQKEQSLIENASPKQSQLDWATGYGCPDNSPCNSRWQGFWKQVNSASLQFRDYIDNPQLYTYRPGQTYILSNTNKEPTVVTPINLATAALYNYTPHVYNGNYNFHKIWQRYFTKSYPNGSLLQVKGELGVWLIQNSKKRPFTSRGALNTRFDPKKIIAVSKTDLDKYETGAAIKFPQYSLVRSPRGTIFLIVDDYRRGFASGEAFRSIGFNPEEVVDGSWEDINAYQEGVPITASTTYALGALLQDNKTGGVYWVADGKKAPIWDAVFLKTKFKNNKIKAVSPESLEAYATVEPVLFGDGELLKSISSQSVFVIADGKKRPIASGKIFEGLGYKWENIITISPKLLYLYPEGPIINEIIESEQNQDSNLISASAK